MSINPQHLRIGNWIHAKKSSHYGIVTGELLALLEKDEKLREKFEYIPITKDLLMSVPDAKEIPEFDFYPVYIGQFDFYDRHTYWEWSIDDRGNNEGSKERMIQYLHQVQNIYFDIMGSELPLPESAKIINLAVPK